MAPGLEQFAALTGVITALSCAEDVPAIGKAIHLSHHWGLPGIRDNVINIPRPSSGRENKAAALVSDGTARERNSRAAPPYSVA